MGLSAHEPPRANPGLARLSEPKQALINRRLRGLAKPGSTAEIPRRGAVEAPLSFAQLRLWFLEQLEPGQPVYHVPFALRLRGQLNVPALTATLNEIVRRHEALRTRFEARAGTPVQIVTEPQQVPLNITSLEHLSGPALQADLQRRLVEEGLRPFDLTSGLLLRASLFRMGSEAHVLLITLHHIASDAWSIEVFLNELTRGYAAFVDGAPPQWPPLPVQYLDFAFWQRQQMADETVDGHLEFWRRKLDGAPPQLDLPTDLPRPAVLSNRGATRSLRLPQSLAKDLERLAQQENSTMFMLLLAAFKALLHRYCDQDDLVVGAPVSRRTQKETENLIGFFLNTLVLRADCSGDPSFRDFLQRVRENALECYAHQQLPFEKLVEALQPERQTIRTPIFQVMFSYQDRATLASSADGLTIDWIEVDLGVAPFDLTLLVEQSADGLLVQMEYKTDLYRPDTIDRMLGHFRTLLEGAVRNPLLKLSELPLLTLKERDQLLVSFNPPSEVLRIGCVHELIEEQAARTPNAIALRFGSQQLTYAELDQRANQLAHFLRHHGVKTETLIGTCLERSPEMIVAVLAILKAGGAYVPLEPDEARERLRFKLEDSGVPLLLTQSGLLETIGRLPAGTRAILLDRDRASIFRGPSSRPSPNVRPENLAYMIYTSGSTGKPKGVLVEHRNLANHTMAFLRSFGLGPQDRILQFAPLSFDVSAEEIFPALASGATLVLRPAGLAVSAQDFHPFICHERLTVLNLPTPYWAQWLLEMDNRNLEFPSSVRLVVAGSDTVTPEQCTLWRKLARPEVRWCNAYGTTEATITATVYEPEGDEVPDSIPIGRPITNTVVYILDRNQRLVPIGVPGEIYIGGGETARGYWNRPELSRLRFVPDPFSNRPGMRLNRTGDFGRWRPDGNIEFIGRRDNQVKIRGFRIELGEVEAALRACDGVKEAVVVARDDGEKRLVAYFVPVDSSVTAGQIQQQLKSQLPAYMVPSAFVSLPELPLLPSSKVDRKALPAPSSERPDLEVDYVPPSDSLEDKLANIWRQVLGLEKVGVNDNFFSLGGHSLLAVRLFTEIERITGWNLPLLTLFQSPTIKALAEAIRRRQVEQDGSCLVPIQASGHQPPLYLVHGAGGGMLWGYANLARHLGQDYPVYVFNSPEPRELESVHSMQEIAARYVKELRAFQSEGPYHLGGYCFGGEVAFEMAQQLVAQGQQVSLLAVMNSMPPNARYGKISFTAPWLGHFARNSWHWFRHFARWKPEERYSFVLRKARLCWKAACRVIGLGGSDPLGSSAEDQIDISLYSDEQRKLWDIHLRASAKYQPKPYTGRITVFRTSFHPFLCSFDPSYGWAEFAHGGVEVKVVPGTHESILDEPHVQMVAAELKRRIPAAAAPAQQNHALHKVGQVVVSSCLWLLEFAPVL